ncbi:hypothetical protein ACFLYA_00765 [Candidatus Dependentiae bacterium]
MNFSFKLLVALLSCQLSFCSVFINERLPLISSLYFHLSLEKFIPFCGSLETLGKIKDVIESKEKGAYLRFEDEDMHLLSGVTALSNDLKSAVALVHKNIIKALPLYSKDIGIFEGGVLPVCCKLDSTLESTNILKKVDKLAGGKIQRVYSPFALHYSAVNYTKDCLNFLKLLKKNNCCLFVGHEDIPRDIVEILFGKSCNVITISDSSNYSNLDILEKACLENIVDDGKYKIIVISTGPMGRALQKRLWDRLDNVFLFDLDSLICSLCGLKKNDLIEDEGFNYKKFLDYLSGDIKILCTAAVLNKHFEGRKAEYIKSIKIVSEFGYESYIVEACKSGNTFLDDYSSHVFYSNVNNPRLRNKGVNEGRSLKEAFNHFDFNDNDMIIKITGRYFFEDDSFISLVENNPDVDAFVKIVSNLPGYIWSFSGCFALRSKYFKDMLYSLDFAKMEKEMIDIERELLCFILRLESEGAKIMYVDKLNFASCTYFGGGGYNPKRLTHW